MLYPVADPLCCLDYVAVIKMGMTGGGPNIRMAKSLCISRHHRENRQGAVEHARPLDGTVTPEQDITLG